MIANRTLLLFTSLAGCVDFTDSQSMPQGAGVDSTEDDEPTGETETTNRLANPGFELGETWTRDGSGYVNQAWATTGDGIYQSDASFTASEGSHAQKIWGSYAGDMPSLSETTLSLAELSAGDSHVFTVGVFTHEDDAVASGSHAKTFLRYFDASGTALEEFTSDIQIDENTVGNTWHTLTVTATVPEDARTGELGLRFELADWDATGAVYLDEASWTSSGTGIVAGERLLAWQDEFDGDALDSERWNQEVLAAYTYNNELQAYTDREDNMSLGGGQLIITARRESYNGAGYTSARLNTSAKAGWTYGRFEGMIQVPEGQGTWPAFWMLPTDWTYGGWPESGEIDIMEHVGCDPNVVHGTVHTGAYNHTLGTQLGVSVDLSSATSDLHLYAIDWDEERIVFSVDGAAYFTFENDGAGDSDTWPFDQAFHFVLNLAVGGDWGGYCGVDSSAFPQEYRVDWVRVYQ
jgi:beta-glucanase (GH16 family)